MCYFSDGFLEHFVSVAQVSSGEKEMSSGVGFPIGRAALRASQQVENPLSERERFSLNCSRSSQAREKNPTAE